MLISSAQMRHSAVITLELQSIELRNRHSHGVQYAPETGVACFFWCAGNLLQKIAAERISAPSNRTLGITHQLRNQVEIANGVEEI